MHCSAEIVHLLLFREKALLKASVPKLVINFIKLAKMSTSPLIMPTI